MARKVDMFHFMSLISLSTVSPIKKSKDKVEACALDVPSTIVGTIDDNAGEIDWIIH